MFIEIHIEGFSQPQIFPIEKAGKIIQAIEKRGKKFRLGKTYS